MAHDEQLTLRIRNALFEQPDISEKNMMGGVCFLHCGNMIGGASRDKNSGVGRFMFRVGKEREAEALSRPGASVMELGERRMSGLILVDEANCDEAALADWLALALGFTHSLPPK